MDRSCGTRSEFFELDHRSFPTTTVEGMGCSPEMSTVTVRAGGACPLTPDSTHDGVGPAAAGATGTMPFSTRQ